MKTYCYILLLLLIVPSIAFMANTSLSNVQGSIYANQAFGGATTVTAGTTGVVPAPTANATGKQKFLADGGSFSLVNVADLPTSITPSNLLFVGARLYAGSTTSIPGTGTNTQVNVNTVEYSSGVNTSIANQIIITTAGYYRLTASVRIATTAATGIYLANAFVNGTVVCGAGPTVTVAGTVGAFCSTAKLLAVGDVVTLGAFQNSGTAQSTVANQKGTYLEVQFLGL